MIVEPWRGTSGVHKVRKPRQLAAVRALWEARDALATQRDVAPGRLLPDAAIVDAAVADPATKDDLMARAVFRGRAQRRVADRWWGALQRAKTLPREQWPDVTVTHDGPPPVHRWGDKDPAAAARLARLGVEEPDAVLGAVARSALERALSGARRWTDAP